MALANRITTLMTSLTKNQLRALDPVERQLFSDQLQRLSRDIQDIESAPKGILADLRNGLRTASEGR